MLTTNLNRIRHNARLLAASRRNLNLADFPTSAFFFLDDFAWALEDMIEEMIQVAEENGTF